MRTTTDKKDFNIRVRINAEQRAWLDAHGGCSLCMRELINKGMADGEPEDADSEGGLDMGDFLDACSERGVNPQKMLDKATEMVWKSRGTA